MKVLLAGGGSGGPVSPVLAVAGEIKKIKPRTEFLFVGTRKGPERLMVEEVGIPFLSVPAARWRRFYTYKNLFAPFVFVVGFLKSIALVRKFRPDVMFSAGGFVAVPVAWACKLFGVRIIIHQQDAEIGLANRLISPFASQITAAFEQTAKQFYSGSGFSNGKLKPAAEWVGNPVRESLHRKNDSAIKFFNLTETLPILLILGGATGAKQINDLIDESVNQLVKNFQVVHVAGKGKNVSKFQHENYHLAELLSFDVYSSILQLADMVVSRAGLSTIAELSALGKASIIIPMPHTHQESNAMILAHTGSALVLMREQATSSNLIKGLNMIKFDPKLDRELKMNMLNLMPVDAARKIAQVITK